MVRVSMLIDIADMDMVLGVCEVAIGMPFARRPFRILAKNKDENEKDILVAQVIRPACDHEPDERCPAQALVMTVNGIGLQLELMLLTMILIIRPGPFNAQYDLSI